MLRKYYLCLLCSLETLGTLFLVDLWNKDRTRQNAGRHEEAGRPDARGICGVCGLVRGQVGAAASSVIAARYPECIFITEYLFLSTFQLRAIEAWQK